MRIWFRPVDREPNRSKFISGHVECRIRMDGQEKDIVFYTSCEDEGMQEIMTKLLNAKLTDAIDKGWLECSQFGNDGVEWPEEPEPAEAPVVGQVDDDDPDYPQGTESEEMARAASDEPQDEDREEVEQVGEEEEDSETQEEGQDEEAPIGTGEGAVTG